MPKSFDPLHHQKYTYPGQVNDWLSTGFISAMNEDEKELQKRAMAVLREQAPQHVQQVQLEHIYRQLALLNYLMQDAESRKVPSYFKTYSIQLSLLGSAQVVNTSMDQILPANPARKSMALMATQQPAIFSHDPNPNIQTPAATGALVMLDYTFLPINTRWEVDAKSALYAISNSSSQAAILGIVEEIYQRPQDRKARLKVEREETAFLTRHPLDNAI